MHFVTNFSIEDTVLYARAIEVLDDGDFFLLVGKNNPEAVILTDGGLFYRGNSPEQLRKMWLFILSDEFAEQLNIRY